MIIRANEMTIVPEPNFKGGDGTVTFRKLVKPEMLKGEARLFDVVTFEPGASIGEHNHVDNYEIYYVLAGKGLAIDDGVEQEVNAGDVIYTADGASHSVRDAGDGSLVMLASVIFENKAE